jgi:hypothetical protein
MLYYYNSQISVKIYGSNMLPIEKTICLNGIANFSLRGKVQLIQFIITK